MALLSALSWTKEEGCRKKVAGARRKVVARRVQARAWAGCEDLLSRP